MAKGWPAVLLENPYRPGPALLPPHLAGRAAELAELEGLLDQEAVAENIALVGIGGVGKSVLLETLRRSAVDRGWLWVGADLAGAGAMDEAGLAERVLADLALVTSSVVVDGPARARVPLSFDLLARAYERIPGLVDDRLKAVIELAWQELRGREPRGVIFAYDEAHVLSDDPGSGRHPLSLLLDVFRSTQTKGIPFMLALAGRPALVPKLVGARAFAARMFRVVTIAGLDERSSHEAILVPLSRSGGLIRFDARALEQIVSESGGYPLYLQVIASAVYDLFVHQLAVDGSPTVPVDSIRRKLDADFFAGPWAALTARQQQLLRVAADLERDGLEFTLGQLVSRSQELLEKPFSASHANQMLGDLTAQGLVYKARIGSYAFALPLLGRFIVRTGAGAAPV